MLPTGWHGRPFDNMHRLTSVSQSENRLLIELESQQQLTFTGNVSVVDNASQLVLDGFDQLVFAWQEYGVTQTPHSDSYVGGKVSFFSSAVDVGDHL